MYLSHIRKSSAAESEFDVAAANYRRSGRVALVFSICLDASTFITVGIKDLSASFLLTDNLQSPQTLLNFLSSCFLLE